MRKEQSATNAHANRNHLPATVDLNFAKVFPNGIQRSYEDGTSILLTDCARQEIRYCSGILNLGGVLGQLRLYAETSLLSWTGSSYWNFIHLQ
jgi:hypothetical protein